MSKILHIISSPRGESSNSIKLANAIIDRLKSKDPGAVVTVKDLTKSPFPHLEEAHLTAFHTPAELHTDSNKAAISHSNQAIAELLSADTIIIGAPMYNFNVSSTLKAWIDHIARAGLTFKYTDHGPEGMIHTKKVYLAVSTGGVYSSGEYMDMDFLTPYMKFMLGFIGLNDVTVFRAEGFAMQELQGTALDRGIDSIEI